MSSPTRRAEEPAQPQPFPRIPPPPKLMVGMPFQGTQIRDSTNKQQLLKQAAKEEQQAAENVTPKKNKVSTDLGKGKKGFLAGVVNKVAGKISGGSHSPQAFKPMPKRETPPQRAAPLPAKPTSFAEARKSSAPEKPRRESFIAASRTEKPASVEEPRPLSLPPIEITKISIERQTEVSLEGGMLKMELEGKSTTLRLTNEKITDFRTDGKNTVAWNKKTGTMAVWNQDGVQLLESKGNGRQTDFMISNSQIFRIANNNWTSKSPPHIECFDLETGEQRVDLLTENRIEALCIQDNKLYYSTYMNFDPCVKIYDLNSKEEVGESKWEANPEPRIKSPPTNAGFGNQTKITVEEDRLYLMTSVTGEESAVQVFNLTPRGIEFSHFLGGNERCIEGDLYMLAVSEGRVYATDSKYLTIWDSDGNEMAKIERPQFSLESIDVSNPSSPRLVGKYDKKGERKEVTIPLNMP